MTRSITLKRINDEDGNCVYYECSKCGRMIFPDPNDGDLMPNLFKAHVASEHSSQKKPGEDPTQAAARIVTEAK